MSDLVIKQDINIPDTNGNNFRVSQDVHKDSSNNALCKISSSISNTQCDFCTFELEKQLHEQYAINNNSKLGALVSLIAALVGVFSVYGIIFVNTSCNFASNFGSLVEIENYQTTIYHIDVLLLVTAVSLLIIASLFSISIFIGVFQRIDQFIVHAIRIKQYQCDKDRYKEIFPKRYCPINKGCIFEICLSVYGKIAKILLGTGFVVALLTILKLTGTSGQLNCCNWSIIVFSIIATLCSIGIVIYAIIHNKKKYLKHCDKYNDFFVNNCPFSVSGKQKCSCYEY